MPPSPIPAPLPPWARAVIWLTPIVGGYLWELLTHAGEKASPPSWRKLSVKYNNTATGAVSQDAVWCSWDLVNITGGDVDSSWTTSDYTTCEGLFDTFFTAMKPRCPSNLQVTEYRWYTRQFNPYSESKPFADSGPPQRVTTKAITGTGAPEIASQVAMTITERTAWPKHWGRVYLPVAPAVFTGPRFTTAVLDSIATSAQTLYAGLQTAEFFPVVPVTQVNKDAARGLLVTTQIAIDDVPDVIRRRRPRNVVYRKALP